MSIADWPRDERPREKLLARGPAVLSDAELLALFIQTGTRGSSAVDVARTALDQAQGLRGLLDLDPARLATIAGIGPARSALLKAAIELATRYLEERVRRSDALTSPAHTSRFLCARLRSRPHEIFACLFLDNRHRVISFEEMFRGDHRRGERASARGRQTRAGAQRGRPHCRSQPSFGGCGAEPVGPCHHQPAERRAGPGGGEASRPFRDRGRGGRLLRRTRMAVIRTFARDPPEGTGSRE